VAVGDRDWRWRGQLGAGQRLLDLGGAAGEVASPAGLAQQPRDLGHLQRAAPFGGGCCAQHGQGLRASQVGAQRGQRRGIELPQGVAQPVDVALSSPDQPLVRPGEDLDRLSLVAVAGDEAVMMPVAADDLGQHPRIPASDLAPEVTCRSR
jgi:hypothetical protein